MRPGCDRLAVARLSYDTIGCQVWLDELPERSGPVQEICELHADRLTVPRGWILCDRRAEQPALFVAPSEPAETSTRAVTVVPTRSTRTRAISSPELFELIDAPDLEPPVEIAVEAAVQLDLVVALERAELEQHADEALPDAEGSEPELAPEPDDVELPSALQATSPLLARAFGATGPQHSVLTQRDGPRRRRRAITDEDA